jgi:hypothetical protein
MLHHEVFIKLNSVDGYREIKYSMGITFNMEYPGRIETFHVIRLVMNNKPMEGLT